MTRKELIQTTGRYLLLLLTAGIMIILGKKVSTVSGCEGCPGKGICNGKSDCSKY